MLPRLLIAVGLTCLAALTLSTACSSSQRRDVNYGTDAGAGYQPEAAVFTGSDDGGDSDADGDGGEDDAIDSHDHVLLDRPAAQPDAGAEADATADADTTAEADGPLELDANLAP